MTPFLIIHCCFSLSFLLDDMKIDSLWKRNSGFNVSIGRYKTIAGRKTHANGKKSPGIKIELVLPLDVVAVSALSRSPSAPAALLLLSSHVVFLLVFARLFQGLAVYF